MAVVLVEMSRTLYGPSLTSVNLDLSSPVGFEMASDGSRKIHLPTYGRSCALPAFIEIGYLTALGVFEGHLGFRDRVLQLGHEDRSTSSRRWRGIVVEMESELRERTCQNKVERACASSAIYVEVIRVRERLRLFVPVIGVLRDVTAKHGGDRTIESFDFPVSSRIISRLEGVRDA